MKSLNTVNVIEIPDTANMGGMSVHAFPDNEDGNKAAEALFKQLVNENTYFEGDERPDPETCLDDYGYFEAGGYYVTIVHTVPEHEPSVLDRKLMGNEMAEKFAAIAPPVCPECVTVTTETGDHTSCPGCDRPKGNGPHGQFMGNEDGGVDDLDR